MQMQRFMSGLAAVVALAAGGAAFAQGQGDHTEGDRRGSFAYFTGNDPTVTEPFEAAGRVEVTLGAWCFEAVGWVDVRMIDEDGTLVGELQVLGEGVVGMELEVPPGTYHFEVDVSHLHIYTWEVLVMPAEIDPAADAEADAVGGAVLPPDTTVELPHAWWGGDDATTDAFVVDGPIDVSLAAWCHTGYSYVEAVVYGVDGSESGLVRVIGQGVVDERLVLERGTYFLRVWSPTMEEYEWELLIERAAGS